MMEFKVLYYNSSFLLTYLDKTIYLLVLLRDQRKEIKPAIRNTPKQITRTFTFDKIPTSRSERKRSSKLVVYNLLS